MYLISILDEYAEKVDELLALLAYLKESDMLQCFDDEDYKALEQVREGLTAELCDYANSPMVHG